MTPPESGMQHASGIPVSDYVEFKAFLEKACGILLGDNKQYLVTSRLKKLMAEYDIKNLQDLIKQMQQFSSRNLQEAVIDAMTTNETLWFRDSHPFEILKKQLLPELQNNNGKIRIWSAACSSGQEPYSLSMTVQEYRDANMAGFKSPVEIVATELSASMLEYAKKAEYNDLALRRGLSNERLKRFFEPTGNDLWRVKASIKQNVRFQPFNLMDNYLSLGKFDVVFCRNVLIYFSAELKADIIKRIHGVLRPGGYLVLGASEGLTDPEKRYEMVQCNPGIIYRAI